MNNMLQLFIGAWLHPWQTMGMVREQPQNSSIKPTVVYIAVVGLISGIIAAVMGYVFPDARLAASGLPKWSVLSSIVLLPLFYLIGSFISSGIVWGVVTGFVNGTAEQFKTIYRLMAVPVAFYPVSTLLAPVPQVGQWLAIALNIWATVVLIGGVIIVMNTPKVRTIVTFVLIFLAFVALAFLASVFSRPQFPPSLAGNDLGAQNFDVTDEDLNAQLDDLVGKQGQNPAAAAPSKAAAPTKK
jgi:hypothetical protein